jgi:hypothetical protein
VQFVSLKSRVSSATVTPRGKNEAKS